MLLRPEQYFQRQKSKLSEAWRFVRYSEFVSEEELSSIQYLVKDDWINEFVYRSSTVCLVTIEINHINYFALQCKYFDNSDHTILVIPGFSVRKIAYRTFERFRKIGIEMHDNFIIGDSFAHVHFALFQLQSAETNFEIHATELTGADQKIH